jgi:cell division septum initiation protein DivIVA
VFAPEHRIGKAAELETYDLAGFSPEAIAEAVKDGKRCAGHHSGAFAGSGCCVVLSRGQAQNLSISSSRENYSSRVFSAAETDADHINEDARKTRRLRARRVARPQPAGAALTVNQLLSLGLKYAASEVFKRGRK